MNSSQDLREVLSNVKNIAVVGASPKSGRDSYIVMEALMHFGYEIFPVNPNYVGNKIFGKTCYPNLKAIKEKVDMVDIFRAKDFIYICVMYYIFSIYLNSIRTLLWDLCYCIGMDRTPRTRHRQGCFIEHKTITPRPL